jgi:hypothetical protein
MLLAYIMKTFFFLHIIIKIYGVCRWAVSRTLTLIIARLILPERVTNACRDNDEVDTGKKDD